MQFLQHENELHSMNEGFHPGDELRESAIRNYIGDLNDAKDRSRDLIIARCIGILIILRVKSCLHFLEVNCAL